MPAVKPQDRLNFRDRLSQLNYEQAVRLLGPGGRQLMRRAGRTDILPEDVYLGGDLLRVRFPGYRADEAVVTLTLKSEARDRLHWNCTACDEACEHVAAALSYLLEQKTLLGLAAPPPEPEAIGELNDEELVRRAIAERQERARSERMRIKSSDSSTPWADYLVTSLVSGKAYRVALRGLDRGASYCNCPDFRTNTLGTCKHVLKVAAAVKRRFRAKQLARPYRHRRTAVYLQYGAELALHVAAPPKLPEAVAEIVTPLLGGPVEKLPDFYRRLQRLGALGQQVHIYPDAAEYLEQRAHEQRVRSLADEIRRDPQAHPLRTELLKIPLLPYQLDGIAFAFGSGRAVLADEMGLGKTIQAVGLAELLAREVGIRKVLVVCPASLKSQWRNEIGRFCDRSVQLVVGPAAHRLAVYDNDAFFTVCNYEQVLRDVLSIERIPWDLIILDEGQRIKNWESKTSRVVKALRSRFALVLSGTPLENRLDELYSVVQFVDDRRLGPGFRFFHQHRITDEKGKVLGYKQLDDLRERLRPVLLRRTRESVRLELPERSTEIIRIAPTAEQKVLHDGHMQVVASIVRKKFLTEIDLMRLRMSLLMCRMAADGTYLVDKEEPNHSSKLQRLGELFEEIADEPSRKTILFSEWTTMLDRIEPLLSERGLHFVRLDGSLSQKQREAVVHEFQTDPQCRFILMTNAGATGLNLQAADTVINVDLPWNPAVLEQRIARAHRMGQKRNVQVFVLVTEQTLEESLLVTLSAKKELALAALDPESDVDAVHLASGSEELKARLEILLGARPEALRDQTQQCLSETEVSANGSTSSPDPSTGGSSSEPPAQVVHRERVAAAGGELLGAAFKFLGELMTSADPRPAAEPVVSELRSRLDQCVVPDAAGRPQLTITLPDAAALDGLAQTLARLLAPQSSATEVAATPPTGAIGEIPPRLPADSSSPLENGGSPGDNRMAPSPGSAPASADQVQSNARPSPGSRRSSKRRFSTDA